MQGRWTIPRLNLLWAALCLGRCCGAAPSGDLAPPRPEPADWPGWRGPTGDGKAACAAPVKWSRTENVVSKADIPGRGHASPVVTHVFRGGAKLEIAPSNDLGDGGFATPAICGGEVFIRTNHHLYRIGVPRA